MPPTLILFIRKKPEHKKIIIQNWRVEFCPHSDDENPRSQKKKKQKNIVEHTPGILCRRTIGSLMFVLGLGGNDLSIFVGRTSTNQNELLVRRVGGP